MSRSRLSNYLLPIIRRTTQSHAFSSILILLTEYNRCASVEIAMFLCIKTRRVRREKKITTMISQRSWGDICRGNVRYYRVPSMESSFVACAIFYITCSAWMEFVSRNPKAWNRLTGYAWITHEGERGCENYTATATLCSFWARTVSFISTW